MPEVDSTLSQPRLVLASGSPRRRQLLAEAGFDFRVVTARDGVEDPGLCSGCGPAQMVVDLAVMKLDDVIDQLRVEPERNGAATLVLAADTVAECDGQILGKPRNDDHAREMMQRLSGREHRVYTGFVLTRLDGQTAKRLVAEPVVTTLRMDQLSADWIDDYADSGAWEGKAGGFGYQDGLGFVHVTEGSESNVVGLPMERVVAELAAAGCVPDHVGEA
ncbi:MAG: nucleoside triphosphate pyrophosphatase [Planctomycetota bacterium]